MAWNSKTRKQPEKKIEDYLVERIEKLGGKCPKWTSPGTRGVPDRIVILPEGVICFVELKREVGGRKSPMQKYWNKLLTHYGFHSFFINTKEKVDKLCVSLMEGVIPDEV